LTGKNLSLLHRKNDEHSHQSIPLYYDDDHLNSFGSEPIIREIMNALK